MGSAKSSPPGSIGKDFSRRRRRFSQKGHAARWTLLALCLVSGLACSTQGPVSPENEPSVNGDVLSTQVAISFRDASEHLGSPIVYRNGAGADEFSILQSLGGGVAAFDFDNDRILDLCFAGGGVIHSDHVSGLPLAVLRQSDDRFQNVTGQAAADALQAYSHGCFSGDYNNDGFADLAVTGYGRTVLWTNLGDGTLVANNDALRDCDDRWTSSAAWGDIDGDGSLDLYAACYVDWTFANNPACPGPSGKRDVCPPRQFKGMDDLLLVSSGYGTFADVAMQSGLRPGGKGLGVAMADFDHDNDVDIYVANDTTANFYYRNDSHAGFEEVALLSGVAVDEQANANGSMGIAVSDCDQDGRLDIWVSNYENELLSLYKNDGEYGFQCVSSQSVGQTLPPKNVSFGCVAGDFDLDADEDLAVTNGHVVEFPSDTPVRQVPIVLRNDRDLAFSRVISKSVDPLSVPYRGRGLAIGDFDRDGRLDLVLSNSEEPAVLALNNTETTGTSVSVRLIGVYSNRDSIGARVTLFTDQGSQLRHVTGGGSYLSSSCRQLHFGVADGVTPVRLEVTWPTGKSQSNEITSVTGEAGKPFVISIIESSQHVTVAQ